MMFTKNVFLFFLISLPWFSSCSQQTSYKVIAFYKADIEEAHSSFVHDANQWFSGMAPTYHFTYDSTSQWDNLNTDFLSNYQLVIFLDSRPESPDQRKAFREYMEKGGAWMGFHFAGFALTPSDFPQDWDWYHDEFLGSGQYKSNTWRPTSAILRVKNPDHPVTRNLPETFISAPNEWYRWEHDLRENPDIQILLSIDSTSFPLGTGPKPHEIWHSGYYPVAWTNKNYRMLYLNMGHNDIGIESNSHSFDSEIQNQFIINGLQWLSGQIQ